jgi:hypothetical protein
VENIDNEIIDDLPELIFPKFKLNYYLFLALIPALYTSALYFFPQLINDPGLLQTRINLGVFFILFPFLLIGIIWVIKLGIVSIKRIVKYQYVIERVKLLKDDIKQLHKEFFNFIYEGRFIIEFEITSAYIYNSNPYIIIKKIKSTQLKKGDILEVMDYIDGKIMGSFEISQVRQNEYYAKNKGKIDAVWLGYIISTKGSSINPNLKAYFLPKEN